MSHQQSRGDRSDSQQRRGARSGGGGGHQRSSTITSKGGAGAAAGGHGPSSAANAPLLSPAVQPALVPSSKRSSGSNGQTRQHQAANMETSDTPRAQQSATPQYQGQYHGHAQPGSRLSGQPSNGNVPRSSRPVTPATSTSTEATAAVPKPESWSGLHNPPQLSFQFGSIGPGFGHTAVQIPARTSSAPPNLDEQKQDLARFESTNAGVPKIPIPSGAQQQTSRPQVQHSGGQQQGPRPQTQSGLSAGIHQPQYQPQHQPQHSLQSQIPQTNSHVPSQQPHLQMPGHHLVPPPQQQGLVQNIYSQHQQGLMQFPQSMGGPQMLPPQLAPLPGQLPQMSHQLPGPLASQMPGPYGVGPFPNHLLQPRTSRAVKIVHPETHEELRFDSKTSKVDSPADSGISSTSVSHVRVTAGPPARSLGFPPGAHHQNIYSPQQNGPHAPVVSTPASGVPNVQSNFSEPLPGQGIIPKPAVSAAAPATSSFGTTPSATSGVNNIASSSAPSVSPVIKPGEEKNPKSQKADKISATQVSEVKESVDAESKNVKLGKPEGPSEVSNLHKDLLKGQKVEGSLELPMAHKDGTRVQEPLKDVQQEPTQALPSKEVTHRPETLPEVKQTSKKKKKKDNKGNKAAEGKKQAETKVVDTYKAKVVTPKVEGNPEMNLIAPSDVEVIPHVNVAKTSEPQSQKASEPQTTQTSEHQTLSTPIDTGAFGHDKDEEKVSIEDGEVVPVTSETLPESSKSSVPIEAAIAGLSLQSRTDELKTVNNDLVDEVSSKEVEPSDNTVVLPAGSESVAAVSEKGDMVQALQESFNVEATESSNSRKNIDMAHNIPDSKISPNNISATDKLSTSKLEDVTKPEVQSPEPPSVPTPVPVKEENSGDVVVTAPTDVRQGNRKKKMKDILAKADAAGTTADLYNAYKAREEVKAEDTSTKVGSAAPANTEPVKQVSVPEETSTPKELDDWEDAVELPSPNVLGSEVGVDTKDGETYTRDFLLTFKEQNTDLPLDFELRPDIAELLVNPQLALSRAAERDSFPGSGRMPDRQLSSGPRRGPPNSFDEERWSRQPPGLNSPVWPDNYGEMGPGGGFRPGNVQGLIPRMPVNMRPMTPGLIPGKPSTPMGRGNAIDSERWQRMPAGQKGLIPSPHGFPPVHKAEKRYEVGKPSDEEEVKQRQIKGILNKLTPQNFDKLFEQVKDVKIQSALTLNGVISQIFDKALTEPTFCEMYAKFCRQLATDMPEFVEDGEKVTFKRVLLNKCQEEFHRGEKEQDEASEPEEDGKEKSPELREELRVKAKRRMLGNIRFIGELYKKQMLTEKIMHECIRKLLGQFENPEEEDVEALCKLVSTIGHMIDQPKAKDHMDSYFERMKMHSNNQKLSSRIRFMLKDVIDLRRNGWQERRKVEGPKKIEEVHRDAVQERQATVAQAGGRLSRGPSMGGQGRRIVAPSDFGMRGGPQSPMFSPSTPGGTGPHMRGQPQIGVRGSSFPVQDVRMEDRILLDSRPLPMPLSQRSVDEGPLTLGPQGGLGRALSMRGQGSGPGIGMGPTDRRFGLAVSLPAYNSGVQLGAERPQTPPERPLLDRPSGFAPGSRSSTRHLERTLSDRSVNTSNASQQHQGSRPSTAPAFVHLNEEELNVKSKNALNEYFSARDLREVTQCVEELRAPKYYPTMVHTWIAVVLEKKNMERELLVKLLISLATSEPHLLKQEHILQGFQMVMVLLEDLAMDVPMAPDYLSKMLVALISGGVISFEQVRDLLKNNEVVQTGYALEIMAGILSGLRQERGEKTVVDIFQSSRLRLDDFVDNENSQKNKSIHGVLQKHNLQCIVPDSSVAISPSIQLFGKELLDHLSKNESVVDAMRWLEKNVTPAMLSDSSFHRVLMTQVLKHSVCSNYESGQPKFDEIRDRLADFRELLKRFAMDKEKQWQYVVAMQLFVHDLDHPPGLLTTLFSTLYDREVITESAYFKWEDDVSDPTPGRDKALRDVYKWLLWLRNAPEQS